MIENIRSFAVENIFSQLRFSPQFEVKSRKVFWWIKMIQVKFSILFLVVLQAFSVVDSVPIQYSKRSTINDAVGNYSTDKLVFFENFAKFPRLLSEFDIEIRSR
jgi:hypothetical protein